MASVNGTAIDDVLTFTTFPASLASDTFYGFGGHDTINTGGGGSMTLPMAVTAMTR